MKVYGQLERAQIQNVTADPTGVQLVVGLIWFRTDLNLYRWYDGATVREAVDLQSAQTLVNKTLTAPTISDPAISGVSTYTEVGATPTNPAAGSAKFYLKDDGLLYKLDAEGNEVPVGSGSGGGLDVFHTEDFEINNVADLDSGNNSVFLGGGVLAGTLADETVAPLNGNRSLKYTQAAGSLNDYFASPIFASALKQQSNDVGLNLYFKYSGNSGDIKIVAYDDTNDVVISSELDLISEATDSTRFSTSMLIPSGVTELRWGVQVVTENIGAVLELVDIEFSTNPFTFKDIIETQTIRLEGAVTHGSVDTKVRAFLNELENVGSSSLFSHLTTTANGTVITILKSGFFHFSYSDSLSGTGIIGISRNSTQLSTNIASINEADALTITQNPGTNYSTACSWSGNLNAGDVIRAHTHGIGTGSLDNVRFTMAGFCETTNVVTPARAFINSFSEAGNSAEVMSTGVATPFGSSNNKGWNGSEYTVQENGTIISLSFSTRFTSSVGRGYELYKNGVTYNTITQTNSDTNHSGQYISSKGEFQKGDTISIRLFTGSGTLIDLDVQHYLNLTESGDASFLSAIPLQKTVYIKDVKANAVSGGTFTSGAWRTRDLNTIEGDINIVSLSSNQFSLGPGKYSIFASAPSRGVDGNKVRLQNITDGLTTLISQSGVSENNSFFNAGLSLLEGEIEILASKTFEIQHRCQTTHSSVGLGQASNVAGTEEIYTQVKITKLR